MKPSAKRDKLTVRSVQNRSRITNNASLLAGADGRTAAARRFHDVIVAITADAGGVDRCAEARLQLIRRFAACAVLAEQLEARLATGEPIDIAEHAQLTSSMVRVAQRIGINRRLKEVVPTLSQYLAKADDEEEVAE